MTNKKTIKSMQADYRPDEKFIKYGPEALTCAELLAIILRTGVSGMSSLELTKELLYNEESRNEDVLGILRIRLEDLMKIKGIGKVKALQIKAVAELSCRIARSRAAEGLSFTEPETIADYYMEQMRHQKTERVVLLLLNSACRLIKDMVISQGTVNYSPFSPREIYLQALKHEAVSVILLHNHPSGDVKPSKADIEGTNHVYDAGKMLGINLLDHIIIGDGIYFSFKEKGLING
ncbi:MAG: RadC family protein [Lachnospiraceae bacterium]